MFKKTIKLWTVAFFFIWESFLFNIKLFTENAPCVDLCCEKDVRNKHEHNIEGCSDKTNIKNCNIWYLFKRKKSFICKNVKTKVQDSPLENKSFGLLG